MPRREVTVIDYGVGNLLSVKRGLEHVGAEVVITSNPRVILSSAKLLLPGVGAFPNAMGKLKKLKLIEPLHEFFLASKPMLAICLGMQLLMETSEEFEKTQGLGFIPGTVVPIPSTDTAGNSHKIPFVGWSKVEISEKKENSVGTLVDHINSEESFYFVHSFMVQVSNMSNQIAFTNYGGHKIVAAVESLNLIGLQFHPEKSGPAGLKILKKFVFQ